MKIATALATTLLLVAGVGVTAAASPLPATAVPAPKLNELARDVARAESVREVKDVQRQYAQYAQFGEWNEMGDLFAQDGTLRWGDEITSGDDIATWLKDEAGGFDGSPGSLHTTAIDQPLVTLSVDGTTAKGRWSGIRFLGDGDGAARVDGGIYENEYILEDGEWKISLLRYYPYYEGDYSEGWKTINGEPVPVVPYHFSVDETGVPIPEPVGAAPATKFSGTQLANRIAKLNDEDDVRNLQHAYGYYADQRMWTDVVDLFVSDDARVTIDGVGVFTGQSGVREAMELQGPEGLTQGILNDRTVFDTIVAVGDGGDKAIARGFDVGTINRAEQAAWEFSTFRNSFVKEDGIWKIKELHLTPLIAGDYDEGWGDGGLWPAQTAATPAFLDVSGRTPADSGRPGKPDKHFGKSHKVDLVDLDRRLSRSVAYDGAENVSAAYSYYIDDSRWPEMAGIHAEQGHKLSPFAGWNITRERILASVVSTYGDTPPPTVKSFMVLHWRPQPVVHVSEDGRSATYRSRLMHVITGPTSAGYLNGGMYNDEFILEDGIWRIWSLNIEEFYWQSTNGALGWRGAVPRDPALPDPPPSDLVNTFPPDLLHADLGVRSQGFRGGSPGYVQWPDIVPMWFHYRNPVSGRVPTNYWPECAPCQVQPDWSLSENGFQQPPTGPEMNAELTATAQSHRGKVQISASATNHELVPIDITFESDFGSKTFSAVTPGKTVTVEFQGRGSHQSVDEVSATLVATYQSGADHLAETVTSVREISYGSGRSR